MELISIIVPIYNVENYLKSCVESILNQSYTNIEIILVNDGSTDKSGEICDKYANRDNRIKVIHKKNKGVSSARNVGLNTSVGKYVAFVDPDDTIESNMYERLISTAIKDKVDIVVCKIKTINYVTNNNYESTLWNKTEVAINKNEIENSLIPQILAEGQYGITSSVNKLYSHKAIKDSKVMFRENMRYGEDARFNLELIQKINSIEFIDESLYCYHIRRRESLTRVFDKERYKQILDNLNWGIKLCKKYGITDIDEYIREYLNNTFNYMQQVVKSNGNYNEKKEIIKEIFNDNTFKNNICKYKCPSSYYKALSIISRIKSYLLLSVMVNSKELIIKNLYRDGVYEN